MVLFKLISGRMIDRADAAMLLRENRAELEHDCIYDWVVRLGLNAEFLEIWRDAFPGEEEPSLVR